MSCKFSFVHKQLLPSENFLLASFIITKEENTHTVEVSGKTAQEISKAAISTSLIFIRQRFSSARTTKWEFIVHSHIHIRKTGKEQISLFLSWPLCNRLAKSIYIIFSSPLHLEAWRSKSYIQQYTSQPYLILE